MGRAGTADRGRPSRAGQPVDALGSVALGVAGLVMRAHEQVLDRPGIVTHAVVEETPTTVDYPTVRGGLRRGEEALAPPLTVG